MNKFFDIVLKLSHVDRRWIFLIIGLSVLLPLFFPIGLPIRATDTTQRVYDTFESLGLDGTESFSFDKINNTTKPLSILNVNALKYDGTEINFKVKLRIDTEVERKYLINGGVLQFVLRNMMDNN